jgi:ABC-type antimicrobial peptide transport system permease subunit
VVVADLPTWLTAANTAEPGVATASELWLDQRPPSGLPLDLASQRAREAELTSDPLARGAISLLLVTALVGLALAAVGLLLTVVGDLRDERGSLRDLEGQGATPAELRRHVLLRAAVVGVLGLAGGAAAGAIVGALVVAVVTVTAGAENALPPLGLAFDAKLIVLALAALVLVSAGAATAKVRRLR